MKFSCRSEIDGLKVISVAAVIFYHVQASILVIISKDRFLEIEIF